MISDHQDRQAVDQWFTSRVKIAVAIVTALSALTMVTSSLITIAGHFG